MFEYLNSASPVICAVIVIILSELLFLRSLKRRDGNVNVFELGVLYSVIVFLYCIFPAAEFLLGDLSFSVLGEFRLYQADPTPAQLGPVFWYYSLYLACFVLAYRKFRGAETGNKHTAPFTDRRLLWVLVGGYACTYVFFAALAAFWRLSTPDSYGEKYLLYSNLPPVLQQLANHTIGIAVLFQLLLMAFLVLNYSRYKRYICLWLCVEFGGIALFGVGSRTGLMVLLLTLVITYDRYVKKLRMRTLMSIGLILLIFFVGLGIVRALSTPNESNNDALLISGNEFDNLFANAYDLQVLKESGQTIEIFPRLYFSDFTRMLPEALVPYGQIDPSQWYVQAFYPAYADQGGGFAFGAISECIAGFGWFDVIWRGLLVGWVFGLVHRYFVSRRNSFWDYVFYLWVTVFSYQTFRVTTFNLVPRACLMLIAWWAVNVVSGLLRAPSSSAETLLSQQTNTLKSTESES